MQTKSTSVGDSVFIDSEYTGSDVHRLVRNADNIDVLVAHDIADDVAAFREAPISRVNLVSFAASQGIPGQPLEATVQGSQVLPHLLRPPIFDRIVRNFVEVCSRARREPESGRHARALVRSITDSISKPSTKSLLAA